MASGFLCRTKHPVGVCALLFACAVAGSSRAGAQAAVAQELPDAPSFLLGLNTPLFQQQESSSSQNSQAPQLPPPQSLPPCEHSNQPTTPIGPPPGEPVVGQKRGQPCVQENPVQPIVSSAVLPPLTWQQKGELAGRDIIDPFNLITIFGYSGIEIGFNSHTAYGPGWRGFGRLSGYSFVEDAQGEFFSTFLISSITHEDPRYHRMPGRPISRRILHAVAHTFVTHHDDGSLMPNYAVLLTYPISAELTNLYVPGVAVNAPSTAKRVGLGLATDPAGSLLAEFLPDIARRIHVRTVFVQQILQQVANGAPSVQ